MDPRFRFGHPSGRRSPPLYNPARISMPVNIGSSYNPLYGADPYATQPLAGTLYGDPITPRTQATVDYRNVPAVPTPPQLHKTQQPPVTPATASTSTGSQPLHASLPSHQHNHHHQHGLQDPATHHSHHAQHQSSTVPAGGPAARSHIVGKDPITRSTSLREPDRSHRKSFSEMTQKRPIIITNTTTNSSDTAANLTSATRKPPSPTRADHFRPPSAEPVRGPSMRDDNYYSVPATSAALRSRGARYSYSGAPMSATLDNDELRRLRGRHDSLHSAPRTDSFPRSRPMSAYVHVPRHGSAGPASLGSNPIGSASASGSGIGSFGDQGYEYTKPSDLARYDLTYEQAAPRHRRRDSFDQNYYRPNVNHTGEMGRSFGFESGSRRPVGSSGAAERSGPPPTTRGLDKINRKAFAESLASSGSTPAGYDSATSIRAPAIQATKSPMDHKHRHAHSIDSLTSSAMPASSTARASSRQKSSGLYPQDEYYRSRYDEEARERRGGDRDPDRDYRYRDYRDRDYRDSDHRDGDRSYSRGRAESRGRLSGDITRKDETERDRVRGTQEYYADGSTANRAFGILVNSRDHQLRQEHVATAGGLRHKDQRTTYADEKLRHSHDDTRTDHGGVRYNGIDRGFVRGAPEPTEHLDIDPLQKKSTDDDMYVHHPQEGMRRWDRSDRFEQDNVDHERRRERDFVPRDSHEYRTLHDVRDCREPRSSYDSRTSRRGRDYESERDREPLGRKSGRSTEYDREREREYASDREQEQDRERQRQRAYERDFDHERDHDYNNRPSRRAGDEEADNPKMSRDKVNTDLGMAAATAAAATLAASSTSNEPSRRPSVRSAQKPKAESRSRHPETSRRGRGNLDDSPDAADNRSQGSRQRPSDRPSDNHGDHRGSESSYKSRTSAYTTPAPILASASENAGKDTVGRMRTYQVDRTPSTSEDEGSDKEVKEQSFRKRSQHKAAASFVPTNTEDLKALKAELAALEAKETQESKPLKTVRGGDEGKSRTSREKPVKMSKADQFNASSPSILTPSSSLSSGASSPRLGAADGLDEMVSSTASSNGKGKERETRRNDDSEFTPERSTDNTRENVAESREQGDNQRGRDQSQPPSSSVLVRLVSPPRDSDERRPVKSILKAPKDKFPEDANPIREGVAPHKDDKSKQQGVPPGARWTRISRKLVNPEALTIGKERFEVRDDFVIVLRVLSREEIEAYTIATAQIRDQHRKEYDRSLQQRDERDTNKDNDRDESRDDDGRHHHRSRRDRDRDRGREPEYDRNGHEDDYYGGHGSTKDLPYHHRRYGSESHANNGMDSRQPVIEYHGSRGSNRPYHRK
ncbi:hypothetical protein SEPCBS57363_001277 [Sporothrix epigloea]|uniref:DUF8035 domain-containing protein n=1 Tax=Sporothrix epigloea TaxID=1892477 RepID=A0ABP0DD52_9PEZI